MGKIKQEEIGLNENSEESTQPKKAGIIKTAIVGAALLASNVQANDLLSQCDINKNGKIDTRQTYKADGVSMTIAKKEYTCSLNYEGDQIRKEGDQIRKEGDQIRKEGDQIRKEGDQIQKNIELLNKIDGLIASK